MTRRCVFAVTWMIAVLLIGSSLQAAQDTLVVKGGKSFSGTIIQDDYKGIDIAAAGGARFAIKRSDIESFGYGSADMRNFNAAIEGYRAGDYKNALRDLEQASQSIPGMKAVQQPLFGQHVLYWKGMCYLQLGDHEKAEDSFARLLAQKEDSAWMFEAGYYEAKALEQRSRPNAKNKYEIRAKEYKEMFEQKRVEEAMRWAVLAKVSALRIELENAIVERNDTMIDQKLSEVLKFKNNDRVWSQLTATDRADIVRVQAMALKALGRYDELVPVLNAALRTAQQENDHNTLKALYTDRGDASYTLFSEAKDDASKKENAQRALMDYLRLDLVFPLSGEETAKVNYRLGKCFVELKDSDWKRRAMHHLQKAKSVRKGADAQAASNLLETVRNMPGPGEDAGDAAENG